MNEKEGICINVANLYEARKKLEKKYIPIPVSEDNDGYQINGVCLLTVKAKNRFFAKGNPSTIEKFLEEEGIEIIKN